MYRKARKVELRIALATALTVLGAGVATSVAVSNDSAAKYRQRQSEEFQQTARQYASQVQRQLDVYDATNQSLAAYMGASRVVHDKDFASFIYAARYLTRLKGINSFGYLPQVAASAAGAFEQRARREFPQFRIRQAHRGADFYYPLLYGVHALDRGRIDALRGIDFASVPDRLETIRAAQASRATAASHVHAAMNDLARTPVVLTFTAVRHMDGANRDGGAGRGVVFSVMNVPALFESVDIHHFAGWFDLEVYQIESGRRIRIYDADGVPHAQAGDAARPFVHIDDVRYADRKWELHFFASPQYIAAHPDQTSKLILAMGMLLSLAAAYGAFAASRQLVIRHTHAGLADKFEAFFEAHPFAVYSMDRERRLINVNQKMARELGRNREDLIGVPAEQFIAGENREMATSYFREALRGHAVAYNNVIRNARGEISDLAVVLIPMMSRGEVSRVLGFAENITERKRVERELHESRQMLQLILDTIPERVFWKDVNCAYLGANRRLLEEARLDSVEQLAGKTDADLVWGSMAQQFREEDQQVMRTGTARLNMQHAQQQRDGAVTWFEVSKVPLKDEVGTVVGVLGVARDITESKLMEAELVRRANYDSLTGLPNRAFFHSQLLQAIKRVRRRAGELALLYFDIDRFKSINDTYGHDAGDEVIKNFATRVRAALRDADFVARLGGDEFVLVIEDLVARADAAAVAEKLIAAMGPPCHIGACAVAISTSIGIAFLDPGMTADQLIKAADDAMYEAKRAGRNCFRQIEPKAPG